MYYIEPKRGSGHIEQGGNSSTDSHQMGSVKFAASYYESLRARKTR